MSSSCPRKTILSCHSNVRFLTLSGKLTLSSGQAQHWTYCQNVRLGVLAVTRHHQSNGPTQFTFFEQFTTSRMHGRAIDKDSSDVQTQEHMARNLVKLVKEISKKQIRAEEELKLDKGRKLRGICCVDAEDKNFNETLKNAKEVGRAYGLFNAVQIAKDFREFILKALKGPKEKNRDDHWRRKIVSTDHQKRKVCLRGSRVYQTEHSSDSKQRP